MVIGLQLRMTLDLKRESGNSDNVSDSHLSHENATEQLIWGFLEKKHIESNNKNDRLLQ